MLQQYITEHWLDIFTTVLGLIYVYLEYKASIALWIVGVVMPAFDVYLYYKHELYGDAGMALYYTFAAIYGYVMWKWGYKLNMHTKAEHRISHLPKNKYIKVFICGAIVWAITYYVLIKFTDSSVPALDAFTNAVSIVALWALSKKYIEQWLLWIVVDIVCAFLYINKGIPFKAGLYALYVVIAVFGYIKWKRMKNIL